MSKELTEKAIDKLSILSKGGRKSVIEAIDDYGGDIIKKESDDKGNIKYYFSDDGFLYYDHIYAEIAKDDSYTID
jgi:hypothetical protein